MLKVAWLGLRYVDIIGINCIYDLARLEMERSKIKKIVKIVSGVKELRFAQVPVISVNVLSSSVLAAIAN